MKGVETMTSEKLKILISVLVSVIMLRSNIYANFNIFEPNYFEILPQLENRLTTVESISVENTVNEIQIDANTTKIFSVYVPRGGAYHLSLDYMIPTDYIDNLTLDVKINGENQFFESRSITLSSLWQDESHIFAQNRFGNDIFPHPMRVQQWQTRLLNNFTFNMLEPFIFIFEEGENTISITNNAIAYSLRNLQLTGKQEFMRYEEYRSLHGNKPVVQMSELVIVEGEQYTYKSESFIGPATGSSPAEYPFEPGKMRLNHLSQTTWSKPSEDVIYTLYVPEDGLYHITFKYSQSWKRNLPSYANIYINGEIPFRELSSYPFHFTGFGYENETINVDGENVAFYLKQGENIIRLSNTTGHYYRTYENLLQLINQINDIAMDIRIVTGNRVDRRRDWEIERYIPNLQQDLLRARDIVKEEFEHLSSLSEARIPASVATLNIAYKQLDAFANDLNYLVNNLDMFTQSASSVAENIAIVLDSLLFQGFSIDRMYLTNSSNDDVPSAGVSFFGSLLASIQNLIYSYIGNIDEGGVIDDEGINVWVQFPNVITDVIRQKTVEEYEAQTGRKVNISILTGEQKLLLAVSAGSAPDAVIGTSVFRPYDFALRGAIHDLREFDDFFDVMDNYHPEMFVPFAIGESIYALPFGADYKVTFYRKDILNRLGLEVPETWDDVIDMLPTLARYDMSFNSPIANSLGLKHIGVTGAFIMQHEGEFYTEGGNGAALGLPNSVAAFNLMTDLHAKYSLPDAIPSFYNSFKRGVLPVGISDMNTYILLKYATPELSNLWGIAPSVGVRNEHGDVNIYQNSVGSGCMILNSSDKKDEAWEFIKWFNSAEVQASFADELRLRFGPTYIWNSANVNAFEQSNAYTEEDKQVILKQLNNTRDIPRNPAHFALERELSSAWNRVVYEGMAPRLSLDDAIMRINREIARKLQEFGYMDVQGNMIRPYGIITGETIMGWRENR